MKKKVIIPIVLVIVVFAIIVAIFVFTRVIGKKPFADLRAEDMTNVTVQLLPPDKTVEMADYTELVNTLNEVVIYGKDNSYKEYSGQAVIYTITMNDGKEITVNAYNPFIIIDGIGYKTKYEPCEKLSQIANELIKLSSEDRTNAQYYLTVGAENVYSIEYSVLDMEPMGIVQSDAPFEKGKVIILEGLTGCSDLRGLRITAFDEVKNVIWTAEVPNSDNEGFTHLQEDDWNITDLIKK